MRVIAKAASSFIWLAADDFNYSPRMLADDGEVAWFGVRTDIW